MDFALHEAIPVLRNTPGALDALLAGLPDEWVRSTEGPGTWSPYDVVGHLIHGERTDWIPRVEHLLEFGDEVPFPVFDREAMFTESRGSSLDALLREFAGLRDTNLDRLDAFELSDDDLVRRGRHPEFGIVTLAEHLSTWVVHDLSHLGQIARAMSRRYADAVGPWRAYLPILGAT